MSQTKALYRLQRIDLELDARRSRLRTIKATLEENSQLRKAQADVTAIQNELRPQEVRLTDLNLEIKTVETHTKQFTQRLYGGAVQNPKELEDLQNKIAERKRRHAQLENELLETMITVEDLQAALAAATKHLEQIEADWATETQSLTDEQQRLRREIKTLKSDRETAGQTINAENLEYYAGLRTRKQGRAVAVLENGACSVCGVTQTANVVQKVRQDQEIVTCTSCGRILVAF